MKISELYERYHIMPQLKTHMLRVAAVGKLVAEAWKSECDADFATQLCLVHDLGNIVKFDLTEKSRGSKFGEIDNLQHWQDIQSRYWKKYGHDAHDATTGILQEAKLEKFIDAINEEEELYFAEATSEKLALANPGSIILLYADCRVTPAGVSSYRVRVNDLAERYGAKSESWTKWTYWFEDWIQTQVNIDLSSITERSVTPMFDELLESELQSL